MYPVKFSLISDVASSTKIMFSEWTFCVLAVFHEVFEGCQKSTDCILLLMIIIDLPICEQYAEFRLTTTFTM
jgi:hypothetical protein